MIDLLLTSIQLDGDNPAHIQICVEILCVPCVTDAQLSFATLKNDSDVADIITLVCSAFRNCLPQIAPDTLGCILANSDLYPRISYAFGGSLHEWDGTNAHLPALQLDIQVSVLLIYRILLFPCILFSPIPCTIFLPYPSYTALVSTYPQCAMRYYDVNRIMHDNDLGKFLVGATWVL